MGEVLATVTPKAYRYTAPADTSGPYIVWAEDGQGDTVWADGKMQEQAIQGTVDYFTNTENDPNVKEIQDALNGVCSWRLNSVQYEDKTKFIHFEWVFEVDGHG